MSTATAPDQAKAPKAAAKPKEVTPPDEQFWQRYSPHHEFPLSSVVSVTLHVFAVLLLIFSIKYMKLGAGLDKIETEAVEFAGGGGGSVDGVGNDKGVGSGAEQKEDLDPKPGPTNPNPVVPPPTPLDPGKTAETKVDFDNETERYVQAGDESKKAFSQLDKAVKDKLRDGLTPGQGRGGSGSGGGKDGGKGVGTGDGAGVGTAASLSKREKRMLRWTMTLDTRSGTDYLNQLAGLKATLAIPTGPGNSPDGYYVIHDLTKRPPDLMVGDIGQIKCINWVDGRPESVKSLLAALRLEKLDVSHFIAFMPLDLEEKLFRIEREKNHWKEDDIFETKFQFRMRGGKFEPFVYEQTRKR